jgi:hypothetical protein
MSVNPRLRSTSPTVKHYTRLNKACLDSQNQIWDQTNEIITRNHSIVRKDLSQAKKIREKLECAVIQERAKIASYKHLDEFNLRKLRGFQRYYNNFTCEHDYGNSQENFRDTSAENSWGIRKTSAKGFPRKSE